MSTVINDSFAIFQQLSFLRPDWFFAFIPLFVYIYFYLSKTYSSKNWQSIIDPQLQDFVLEKDNHKQSRHPIILVFIAASLCITALAGPVYKKLPQPVYQEKSALVVLLDLSQSMNANDIKPSRLARAKLELLDILKTRKAGQTAFIVYAADAFSVTPLTDDNATIANLIPALETSMMPAQGSNLSKALAKAFSLLTQAGVIHGNVLVITDDIRQQDEAAIKKLASQGHRLSIFGVGTTDGAPIPLAGSFLLDKKGAIVVPKLSPSKLQNFALAGGGLYTSLTADDRDTLKLTGLFQSTQISKETNSNTSNINADIWREEGHWLLLPLLFFAALWARKGWIAMVVLFILPLPQPAYAIGSNNLWSSEDQKAMRAFNDGKIAEAAEQFNNQEWKASALYRKGDYQTAVDTLKDVNTSDGYYNKANALAKLGNFKEAIKAYDKAIDLDPDNSDAKYNREQVVKALKKQQDSSQDKKGENQNSSDKDKSEDSNSENPESGNSESEDSESENSESNNSDSQNKETKEQNAETSPAKDHQTGDRQQSTSGEKGDDEKQSEEDLKQRNAEQEAQQQKEEQAKYKQDAEKNQLENNTDDRNNNPEEIEINPIEVNPEEASISEAEKATEQWLKRIPDDPGGLLKRKFLYQYNQLPNQIDEQEPW